MYPNKEQEEIPIKSIIEKQGYKKSVSECKKLRSFVKSVVGRNITTISKKRIR